ncbi:ATP-binding protein [Streptomyces akebiae]|uniref:ATP-binding protein n=1 Tax=Streptomyces akebiae TaxID=2865673 RepID=UPI002175B163|nr:LuxR C-terminal-related transcriptional regulator [Streptomyces akebiae]
MAGPTDLSTVQGNLPGALTTFVGRRREVAEIRRLLSEARLVTLTGVGGVGKTRLALEAAFAARTGFADGVWLADLASVPDPSEVAGTVAMALGGLDLGIRPVADHLSSYLSGRQVLLVLDNCEHVIDACAGLVQSLLSSAPGLRILATSRHMLAIPAERLVTVHPLPQTDAVDLLRDRAAAVGPKFQVTDRNWSACARLCRELDGLPLAIELAAARLRTLTVEQVADRLEDRFGLLTSGNRLGPPRQRSLRAMIDYSYELCGPAEQLLWHRLSVFSGSFSLDAAEGVCSGDGMAPSDVMDLLDRLVNQSIVLATDKQGRHARYQLLEAIREYGRERLAESGEEQLLRRRHRDFFLALAQHIDGDWCGPRQAENMARLRAEHGNLRSALRYRADPRATLALAAALRFHWVLGGLLGEGRRQLEHALTAAPEPTPARADGLICGAWVALCQGDHAVTERWLTEAEKLGDDLGLPSVKAWAETLRASLATRQERWAEARALAEAALPAQRALQDGPGEIYALLVLGLLRILLRDPRATQTCQETLAAAEAHGDLMGRGYALWLLGWDAWVRGDLEAGTRFARSSLDTGRGFHDYLGTAQELELLACLSADGGHHNRAARLLGAATAVLRELGTEIAAVNPYAARSRRECEKAVVRALGPQAYGAAFDEGARHSTPAQAIDYGLGSDDTGTGVDTAPDTATNPLTHRENQVAALVAQGKSNQQIASALALSPRTAEFHIKNILAKLAFGSRAQIAAWWTGNHSSAS